MDDQPTDAEYRAIIAARKSANRRGRKPAIEPRLRRGRPPKGKSTRDIAIKRVKAQKRLQRPDGSVEPFPRERFLKFLSMLSIQSKDYGLIVFDLLGSQRYLMDEIIAGLDEGITTFVILKNRQAGISTFFLALDLFWAFEHPGLLGVFATHDEGSRDQFRNQIEVFLTTLPKSHKIDYETNNRLMLVLKNASLFRYLVAGTKTTTNKLGRSGGCNYAHCTEVAFWGSAEDLKALMQTFSETYRHRLYAFESTANGFNHFEDMWRIAQESPAQKAVFIGWWRDERNEFTESHPLYLQYMPQGTTTPLSALERRKIKAVKEEYGFSVTAGQVAWYRFHLETKCSGDQLAMDQEMPWTADDAFISSGGKLFSAEALTAASKDAKKHLCQPFLIKLTDAFTDTQLQKCGMERAELKIWEHRVAGAKYIIGADPIFGSSDTRDNGIISVYRSYADCCVQVAEYASPSVSAYQFAWVIAFLAGLYDDVYLVLEMTGPGAVVYEEMKQLKQKLSSVVPNESGDIRNCLRHMRHFLYSRSDTLNPTMLLQWKSSEELRRQMLYLLQDGMYTRRLRPRSMHCLDEMRWMTVDEGYMSVPAGKTDDRIFGTGLAYWGWDRRLRRRMKLTIAESQDIEERGDPAQIEGMVRQYLSNAKINVALQ